MRIKGEGYRSIASHLGLTRDTVRNFCRQNSLSGYAAVVAINVQEQIETGYACMFCGKKIIQHKSGRRKKFCSDICRREWWKRHPEKVDKKDSAIYKVTCSRCGKEFESYGNENRKYCSHNCYIKDRFYTEEQDGV